MNPGLFNILFSRYHVEFRGVSVDMQSTMQNREFQVMSSWEMH